MNRAKLAPTMAGSQAARQSAVNRLIAGSNPALPAWINCIAVALLLVSCGRPVGEAKAERDQLESQVETSRKDLEHLNQQRESVQGSISELQQNEAVLRALKEGKSVRYVLHLSIRQIHYSINIRKQLADVMNEEKFDIVTDRESYEAAHVGQDLFESFRAGSAIFKHSMGSWRIKIEGKNAVTE